MHIFKKMKRELDCDICFITPAMIADADIEPHPSVTFRDFCPWDRMFLESKWRDDTGRLFRHGALVSREIIEGRSGDEFMHLHVDSYAEYSGYCKWLEDFDLFEVLRDPNTEDARTSFALWVYASLLLIANQTFLADGEDAPRNLNRVRETLGEKGLKLSAAMRKGDTMIYKSVTADEITQSVRRMEQQRQEAAERAPKREHDVRGHWRHMQSGKRVWIRAHRRGRADLGTISHVYDITLSDIKRNKPEPE